jgi:hypothetical protein
MPDQKLDDMKNTLNKDANANAKTKADFASRIYGNRMKFSDDSTYYKLDLLNQGATV